MLGYPQRVTGSLGAWAMKLRRLVAIPGTMLLVGATMAAAPECRLFAD